MMRAWAAMGVVLLVWACAGAWALPDAAPDPEAEAEADPARGKRQLLPLGSMLQHVKHSVSSGLYTLGSTLDRHVVPGVRYATDRLTKNVAQPIGKAIAKAGNHVVLKAAEGVQATAHVVSTRILPALEDRLVTVGNAAVPYINRGIDALQAGLQRGATAVSRSTAKGFERLGSKVLGEQRHNRVKSIASNIQGGITSGLNELAGAISRLNSPPQHANHHTNHYDYHDYVVVSQYASDYDHYYDPDFTTAAAAPPPQIPGQTQPPVRTVGEALSRVVDNTAYSLSTRILGHNLTNAMAPIAKSMSNTVGQTLPAVGFGDGRIIIDLPGSETEKADRVRGCTTPTSEPGFCKDLSDCPELILDLGNLRRSVCFKSLFVPGVCCPASSLDDVNSVNDQSQVPGRPRPVTSPPPLPPRPLTTRRPNPIAGTTPSPRPIRPLTEPPRPDLEQPRCGVPRVPTFRVVGGEESRRGQWPWMAAIWLHGPKKTEFWCGGSLISRRYVLTAAHCTKDSRGKTFNAQQFSVRLGDHNIFSESDDFISNPQTYRVSEIRPHPDFKAHGFYNDVALIRLDRGVDFSEYILPVCLPPEEFRRQPLDHLLGQTPSVIGWGSTFYGGHENPTLREAQLPVWKNSDCDDAYFQPITEIFLCAGFVEGGRDACQGDSGGPLQLYTGGRWVQVGLVSFGNRCAEPGYPGVYTRISHFMPWIRENMR